MPMESISLSAMDTCLTTGRESLPHPGLGAPKPACHALRRRRVNFSPYDWVLLIYPFEQYKDLDALVMENDLDS